MPEHYRALIVILLIAAFTFTYFKKNAVLICNQQNFNTWRKYWFIFTLIAFLSNNFWVFMLMGGLLMLKVVRNSNHVAIFFLLLFTVPPAGSEIPGFGLINYFIELNHIRLLALTLLIPAYFIVRKQPYYIPFGKLLPDKILILYLCLIAILNLRDTSLTDTLRQSFYLGIDVFLPYVVISRSVNTLQKFKEATFAFLMAVLILALIGAFEFTRHWLLYTSLTNALGIHWPLSNYLGRTDLLRALASTGQAIVLGYVIMVAIGFYLFLQNFMPRNIGNKLAALALFAGAIAPLSRGPWIGVGILIVVFIATGRNALRKMILLLLISLIALPIVATLPGGNKIINLLPFIGETEHENIDYREKLIDNSMIVIKRNLMFGSVDYLKTPEMQAMKQGEGIIDIVNTYILVALESGLVGLCLFVGFFLVVLRGIHTGMKIETNRDSDYYLLGRVLLCSLVSILFTIATVSSITFIPIVYWSVGALGIAYNQMMSIRKKPSVIYNNSTPY